MRAVLLLAALATSALVAAQRYDEVCRLGDDLEFSTLFVAAVCSGDDALGSASRGVPPLRVPATVHAQHGNGTLELDVCAAPSSSSEQIDFVTLRWLRNPSGASDNEVTAAELSVELTTPIAAGQRRCERVEFDLDSLGDVNVWEAYARGNVYTELETREVASRFDFSPSADAQLLARCRLAEPGRQGNEHNVTLVTTDAYSSAGSTSGFHVWLTAAADFSTSTLFIATDGSTLPSTTISLVTGAADTLWTAATPIGVDASTGIYTAHFTAAGTGLTLDVVRDEGVHVEIDDAIYSLVGALSYAEATLYGVNAEHPLVAAASPTYDTQVRVFGERVSSMPTCSQQSAWAQMIAWPEAGGASWARDAIRIEMNSDATMLTNVSNDNFRIDEPGDLDCCSSTAHHYLSRGSAVCRTPTPASWETTLDAATGTLGYQVRTTNMPPSFDFAARGTLGATSPDVPPAKQRAPAFREFELVARATPTDVEANPLARGVVSASYVAHEDSTTAYDAIDARVSYSGLSAPLCAARVHVGDDMRAVATLFDRTASCPSGPVCIGEFGSPSRTPATLAPTAASATFTRGAYSSLHERSYWLETCPSMTTVCSVQAYDHIGDVQSTYADLSNGGAGTAVMDIAVRRSDGVVTLATRNSGTASQIDVTHHDAADASNVVGSWSVAASDATADVRGLAWDESLAFPQLLLAESARVRELMGDTGAVAGDHAGTDSVMFSEVRDVTTNNAGRVFIADEGVTGVVAANNQDFMSSVTITATVDAETTLAYLGWSALAVTSSAAIDKVDLTTDSVSLTSTRPAATDVSARATVYVQATGELWQAVPSPSPASTERVCANVEYAAAGVFQLAAMATNAADNDELWETWRTTDEWSDVYVSLATGSSATIEAVARLRRPQTTNSNKYRTWQPGFQAVDTATLAYGWIRHRPNATIDYDVHYEAAEPQQLTFTTVSASPVSAAVTLPNDNTDANVGDVSGSWQADDAADAAAWQTAVETQAVCGYTVMLSSDVEMVRGANIYAPTTTANAWPRLPVDEWVATVTGSTEEVYAIVRSFECADDSATAGAVSVYVSHLGMCGVSTAITVAGVDTSVVFADATLGTDHFEQSLSGVTVAPTTLSFISARGVTYEGDFVRERASYDNLCPPRVDLVGYDGEFDGSAPGELVAYFVYDGQQRAAYVDAAARRASGVTAASCQLQVGASTMLTPSTGGTLGAGASHEKYTFEDDDSWTIGNALEAGEMMQLVCDNGLEGVTFVDPRLPTDDSEDDDNEQLAVFTLTETATPSPTPAPALGFAAVWIAKDDATDDDGNDMYELAYEISFELGSGEKAVRVAIGALDPEVAAASSGGDADLYTVWEPALGIPSTLNGVFAATVQLSATHPLIAAYLAKRSLNVFVTGETSTNARGDQWPVAETLRGTLHLRGNGHDARSVSTSAPANYGEVAGYVSYRESSNGHGTFSYYVSYVSDDPVLGAEIRLAKPGAQGEVVATLLAREEGGARLKRGVLSGGYAHYQDDVRVAGQRVAPMTSVLLAATVQSVFDSYPRNGQPHTAQLYVNLITERHATSALRGNALATLYHSLPVNVHSPCHKTVVLTNYGNEPQAFDYQWSTYNDVRTQLSDVVPARGRLLLAYDGRSARRPNLTIKWASRNPERVSEVIDVGRANDRFGTQPCFEVEATCANTFRVRNNGQSPLHFSWSLPEQHDGANDVEVGAGYWHDVETPMEHRESIVVNMRQFDASEVLRKEAVRVAVSRECE